ncbi:hypothetical protein FCV58_15050 [Vibrio sp. F13]|uniref:hypothetical protein n=1 Tax=Vibrio sp. F13 TaxID=2070777 RepID=UPI0010BDC3E8|nr:hypothetical protein [Vibrio sp. F13]TKF64191.1 hypothetical protein FCV58_15050 [Vibrio sp. F13]
MLLSLEDFFTSIEQQNYTIIKPSDKLPRYDDGDDVDIFCYDKPRMIESCVSFLSEYISHEFSIEVNDSRNDSNTHVDLVFGKKIIFRFDIYGSIPEYNNVLLKRSYFSSVIENAVEIQVLGSKEKYFIIKVPCEVDNAILRYIEYHEYFEVRPDKIKHIDYILDYCSEQGRKIFLDKLHFYLSFPQTKAFERSLRDEYDSFILEIKDIKKNIVHSYKQGGVKYLLNKVRSKLW